MKGNQAYPINVPSIIMLDAEIPSETDRALREAMESSEIKEEKITSPIKSSDVTGGVLTSPKDEYKWQAEASRISGILDYWSGAEINLKNTLEKVNQVEKKFGLDDFSLNVKLQGDKLVITNNERLADDPKEAHQLKTTLEEELNKGSLGAKSEFKKLLMYLQEKAYRDVFWSNDKDVSTFVENLNKKLEKTNKLDLPPVSSIYHLDDVAHLTLKDFYTNNSASKRIIDAKPASYDYEHFDSLSKQPAQSVRNNLDSMHNWLNYHKANSANLINQYA